jgi:hypothetical protein
MLATSVIKKLPKVNIRPICVFNKNLETIPQF